ncbi:hypothetical protein D0865_00745 [Hortaea werneckii]|uniref:Uncharacterized protein n=1 Tax=Hortaea werneckii TaxID=91943 RepID=A0A3M7DC61_HORWE|nr:hypothetical protein D0865_00745 [Hortaea werneckii]
MSSTSADLTGSRSSYQAVFALDVITAAIALTFLGLATKPTFQRLIERRLSVANRSHATPLKTSLGTYLFFYPGLFCFFLAYAFYLVQDVLKTAGSGIQYHGDLELGGRRLSGTNGYERSIAVLSYATSLASILFTTLINGGVWIYSNHVTSNSTGISEPGWKSIIWNTFIMLAILCSGIAAWGLGISGISDTTSWSERVHDDEATKIVFVVYRCIVIAASISVSVEVIRRYNLVRNNSGKNVKYLPQTPLMYRHDADVPIQSRDRPHLARFATVLVPLIWLRNIFIIYDIVLIFVNTSGWSTNSVLATLFLLIIFGQFANLTILGMILYGAWQTGKTVNIFSSDA